MTEEDIKALENYSYTMSAISSATEQDTGIGNLIYKFVQAFKEQQKEIEKKDKMIDEMLQEFTDCEFELKCSNCNCECEKDYDQLYTCNKQYFENKVEGE